MRNASLLAELMQPGVEAGNLLQADGGLDSARVAMEALKAEAAAERGAEREAAARAAAADTKRARRAAEAALGEELAAAASSEAVAAAAARFRRHTGVDLARGVPLSGEPPAAAAFWAGIRRSVAPPEEVAALHAEPRRRVTQL